MPDTVLPGGAPPPPSPLARRHVLAAAGAAGLGGLAAAGLLARTPGGVAGAQVATGAAWVNVRAPEFGAAGHPDVDDAPAIQRALNYVGYFGGGTVYVPPGRFRVGATLLVPSGVTIEGCGAGRGPGWRGCSQIYVWPPFTGSLLRNADPAGDYNITLRRLRLSGAPTAAGNPPAVQFTATQFAGCHDIVIEDCTILQGGTATLELHHVSMSQVRHCQIGGDGPCLGAGIRVLSSADNRIAGNQITTGCTYERPGDGGPGIELRAAANIVDGNMVFFSKRGIEAYDPFQTIVSNRVEMNMGSGIYVATDQGATITGNSIFLNGAGGPGFDVGAGIELGPASRGIVMTGNLIANWAEWTQQQHRQRYGIVLRGAADSPANVHSGNAFVGMEVADVGRLA